MADQTTPETASSTTTSIPLSTNQKTSFILRNQTPTQAGRPIKKGQLAQYKQKEKEVTHDTFSDLVHNSYVSVVNKAARAADYADSQSKDAALLAIKNKNRDPLSYQDPKEMLAATVQRQHDIINSNGFQNLNWREKEKVLNAYFDKVVAKAYQINGQKVPDKELWLQRFNPDRNWLDKVMKPAPQAEDFYTSGLRSFINGTRDGALSAYVAMPHALLTLGGMLDIDKHPDRKAIVIQLLGALKGKDQLADNIKRGQHYLNQSEHINKFTNDVIPDAIRDGAYGAGTTTGDLIATLPLYHGLGEGMKAIGAEELIKSTKFGEILDKSKLGKAAIKGIMSGAEGYGAAVLQDKTQKQAATEGGEFALMPFTLEPALKFLGKLVGLGGKTFASRVTSEALEDYEPDEPKVLGAKKLDAPSEAKESSEPRVEAEKKPKVELDSTKQLEPGAPQPGSGISADTPETQVKARLQLEDATAKLRRDDKVLNAARDGAKNIISQVAEKLYPGRAYNTLSKSQRIKVKAAVANLIDFAQNKVAASEPELNKFKITAEITEAAEKDSNFKASVDQFQQIHGISLAEAQQAYEKDIAKLQDNNVITSTRELNKDPHAPLNPYSDRIVAASEQKLDNIMKVQQARLKQRFEAFKGFSEAGSPAFANFGMLYKGYGEYAKKGFTGEKLLNAYLEDISPEDFSADLKDMFDLKDHVIFESKSIDGQKYNPTLWSWAYNFKKDLPAPYRAKIKEMLGDYYGIKFSPKELDIIAQNSMIHMKKLARSGRLAAEKNVFSTTQIEYLTARTKWQNMLHIESDIVELQTLAKAFKADPNNMHQVVALYGTLARARAEADGVAGGIANSPGYLIAQKAIDDLIDKISEFRKSQ